MRILGMISGTSHDGIDVAIVDFAEDANPGSAACDGGGVARIEYVDSVPYPRALRARLVAALPPAQIRLDTVCQLDTEIGQAFANAAKDALATHARLGFAPVTAICSHGQTVYHWVDAGTVRGTLQLGQPAWIAAATGLPVIADVRAADITAGGQGAPLVPILDRILLRPFAEAGKPVAALNLGGIANVTVLAPNTEPLAWDIGPANALIDTVVADSPDTPAAFDKDGALATAGSVHEPLLARLLDDPYYRVAAPKSTGKEHFHLDYVRQHLAALFATAGTDPREHPLPLPDLVATLTELTARTVADALAASGAEAVFVSGGGVRNPFMMRRIGGLLPGVTVETSDALGVPVDAKEAVAFALIGWLTAHGAAGNVPSCTGAAGERVLGSITPGLSEGLRGIMAADADATARNLRFVPEEAVK